MNVINRKVWGLVVRYLFILALSINSLFIIYYLMGPITYFLSLFTLELFTNVDGYFLERLLVIGGVRIELVEACIAGAAYYLLLALNLSTPLRPRVRVKSIAFLIFSFLIINVLRIVIFSLLAVNNYNYFDSLHLFTWYFLSILMVAGVWFLSVKVLDIRSIPLVSDIVFLKKMAF